MLHVIEQTEARLGDAERLTAEQRQAFEKLAQGYADLKAQIADLKREKFLADIETHAQASSPFGFLPEGAVEKNLDAANADPKGK